MLITPNHGSKSPSRSGKEPKELFDDVDTQSEDFCAISLTKGDGELQQVMEDVLAFGCLGVVRNQVAHHWRWSKRDYNRCGEDGGIFEHYCRLCGGGKIQNEKKKKLETLKATDVEKVELPRPAADVDKTSYVPMPIVKVLKAKDVHVQVISEEIF
ncbi:hypothetical protein K7X08_016463 [Anisodus acutangulus]|uniref:Uncharacterized protein n=1 Tax=Anisodus acutangulus TaxID=402998 RepID=A0A9Q1LDS9_9SOLA|nr:hypothetical protein K7X08_016463 [Anisodus acutangulus]